MRLVPALILLSLFISIARAEMMNVATCDVTWNQLNGGGKDIVYAARSVNSGFVAFFECSRDRYASYNKGYGDFDYYKDPMGTWRIYAYDYSGTCSYPQEPPIDVPLIFSRGASPLGPENLESKEACAAISNALLHPPFDLRCVPWQGFSCDRRRMHSAKLSCEEMNKAAGDICLHEHDDAHARLDPRHELSESDGCGTDGHGKFIYFDCAIDGLRRR